MSESTVCPTDAQLKVICISYSNIWVNIYKTAPNSELEQNITKVGSFDPI